MKRLLFIAALFIPGVLLSDGVHAPPLNIRTVDGTVSNYPYRLIFQNGCLQDNHDGTMTVTCGTGTVTTSNLLLLEDASYFLFEDGTKLVFEQ